MALFLACRGSVRMARFVSGPSVIEILEVSVPAVGRGVIPASANRVVSRHGLPTPQPHEAAAEHRHACLCSLSRAEGRARTNRGGVQPWRHRCRRRARAPRVPDDLAAGRSTRRARAGHRCRARHAPCSRLHRHHLGRSVRPRFGRRLVHGPGSDAPGSFPGGSRRCARTEAATDAECLSRRVGRVGATDLASDGGAGIADARAGT